MLIKTPSQNPKKEYTTPKPNSFAAHINRHTLRSDSRVRGVSNLKLIVWRNAMSIVAMSIVLLPGVVLPQLRYFGLSRIG